MNFLNDELVNGFVEEVKNLTNEIKSSLENYKISQNSFEIEKSFNNASNINESSSLLGFDALSHISYLIKEVLKEQFDDEKQNFVQKSLDSINIFADGIVKKNLNQVELLAGVIKSYRRLRQLPEENDHEEILNLAKEQLNLSTVEELLEKPNDQTLETTKNSKIINSQETTNNGSFEISGNSSNNLGIDPQPVDEDIFDIFKVEALELISSINSHLPFLKEDNKTDSPHLTEIRRAYHTMKGASGMIGLDEVSTISKKMENMLDDILENSSNISENTSNLITRSSKLIQDLVTSNKNNGGIADEINNLINQIDYQDSDQTIMETPQEEKEVINPFLSYKTNFKETDLPEAIDENNLIEKINPFSPNTDNYELEIPETIGQDESLKHTEDFISDDLMDIFKIEADELLESITLLLPKLSNEPGNIAHITEIRRAFHTLKGASSMVGASTISKISHKMEDLLDEIYENPTIATPETTKVIFNSTDLIEDIINSNINSNDVEPQINKLFSELDDVDSTETESTFEASDQVSSDTFSSEDELISAINNEIREDNVAGLRTPGDFVRISTDRLNELINLVSELFINRSTFEQQFGNLRNEFEELKPSIERLKRLSNRIDSEYEVMALGQNKITGTGNDSNLVYFDKPRLTAHTSSTESFDELEFDRYTEFHLFSRELAETANDVSSVGTQIENVIDNFDNYQNHMSNLTSEIEDKIMNFRMVPLSSLSNRFQRIVRNTSETNNKKVDLEIIGEFIEFDKTILEDISDPLIHILRNSVYHGIESPEKRLQKGKSETGNIKLEAYYEGTQTVIKVSDDGQGINPELIKNTAIKNGIISSENLDILTNEELFSLIYLPGFSTAAELSEISGRGVGMDIVKATVDKMKGTISIDSELDKGVTFTVRLPMSLSVARVLMVESGREDFAIPSADVIKVLRTDNRNIKNFEENTTLEIDSEIYPVIYLSSALNLKYTTDSQKDSLTVLIVNAGETNVALVVDNIKEEKEIVIKNLGNHLKNVRCISGATLTGDGSVILIINTSDLSLPEPSETTEFSTIQPEISESTKPNTLDVLIVDDSVSVRRILSNTIKLMGWNSITAKDGLEAFEIIQGLKNKPDVILLDIEMPRMDGYELTSTLRSSNDYNDIPIIIITSRAGDKHRTKAYEVGVSDYLVKPYQDEVLISKIQDLVKSN